MLPNATTPNDAGSNNAGSNPASTEAAFSAPGTVLTPNAVVGPNAIYVRRCRKVLLESGPIANRPTSSVRWSGTSKVSAIPARPRLLSGCKLCLSTP